MPELTFDELKGREREARRELIVNCAKELFSEKNFKSISVRDIAKMAGVSPGTIYRYYESLDELFLEIFYMGTREIKEVIEEKYEKGNGLTIRRLCEIYVGFLNENISYYQMMGHFIPRGILSREEIDKLNPLIQEVMGLFEKIITEADYEGDIKMMSCALISALNGIMTSYAQYPGRSREELKSYTLILAGFIADFFEMGAKREYY